jgi:hypothetical protein
MAVETDQGGIGTGTSSLNQDEAPDAHNNSTTSWKDVPTRTLSAGGVEFAYRQLGPSTGVPVIFLTHLVVCLVNS